MFDYDPSRAGSVPVRLLDDFQGILQATKAAKPQGKGKPTQVSKADVALSHINKLYAIERQIKESSGSLVETESQQLV